jgi:hypothetical protein
MSRTYRGGGMSGKIFLPLLDQRSRHHEHEL